MGIKTPPYTYHGQFQTLIDVLLKYSHPECPVDFITATNTLGCSLVLDDATPALKVDPLPRSKTMPPLPDLRFEQSYLKSIEHAQSWKGVLWITLRDQVG